MPITFDFNCPMDWDAMEGDDTRRHCGACNKHVTNISNMAPSAARQFLERSTGKSVCVQAAHDGTGRVLFARAAASTALAGSLFITNPAVADGQIPNLAHEPSTTEEGTEPGPVEAGTDPTATDDDSEDVLEDVTDDDCEGDLELPDRPMIRGKIAYVAPPTVTPTPVADNSQ